jgi:maltose phosphorylase
MPLLLNKYYETDPWNVIEEGFDPAYGKSSETIFSLANEFMSVRGYFDEGYSGGSTAGSYINGVYYKENIPPYWCKGLAESECFILGCVDWLYTRIVLDGEILDLNKCKFKDYKRILDMKRGILTREFTWETSGGKQLRLSFIRFTSIDEPSVGCQRIIFEPLNFDGRIEVQSCLGFYEGEEFWSGSKKEATDSTAAIMAHNENRDQYVFSSSNLHFSIPTETKIIEENSLIGQEFSLILSKGNSAAFDKIVINHACTQCAIASDEAWKKGCETANNYIGSSFDELMERHAGSWAEAWDKIDIRIDGNDEKQQDIRYCIFRLHQAFRGSSETPSNIISEADDGRSRWSTEAYILPFYLLSNKTAARKLLELRYNQLPQAIERAIEVGCSGACYPLTTIDGTESCTWWEHSQLQIHISVVVAYGIWNYTHVTGDKQFLYTQGVEMLIQICRYYASRGRWGQRSGTFGIYGVMGADELKMMVHNNAFTNVLVKKAFDFTINVLDEMKTDAPSRLDSVIKKMGLGKEETNIWGTMSEKMIIPYDKETGIFEQNEGFFDMPHIDIKSIPENQFPVEDHWAYDRIFRYDMINQPDVLLLLFLYNNDYSIAVKRANYEYYEPRCSHEALYSPGIHSILATELGEHKKAYEYANYPLRINMDKGLPVTALAANWLNIVYGYGGLRTDGDKLSINPTIPKDFNSFCFSIVFRDVQITVDVSRGSVSLKTSSGSTSVIVFENEYIIDKNGISVQVSSDL